VTVLGTYLVRCNLNLFIVKYLCTYVSNIILSVVGTRYYCDLLYMFVVAPSSMADIPRPSMNKQSRKCINIKIIQIGLRQNIATGKFKCVDRSGFGQLWSIALNELAAITFTYLTACMKNNFLTLSFFVCTKYTKLFHQTTV